MIKKLITMVALLGVATLAQANNYSNNYTLASGLKCDNSSFNCSVPTGGVAAGYQISDCVFTFTSCNIQSRSQGYLSCDLFGTGVNCTLGSQHGSTQTWTCTLDSDQIACMNQCLASGSCNFGIQCQGNWNIGQCSCSYDCTKRQTVPDSTTTVCLLGAALVGIELLRRQLAPAMARIKK